MNIKYIEDQLEKMRDIDDDLEVLHGLEDDLREEFIQYIADHKHMITLSKMAKLILSSNEIANGDRWYA